MGVRYIKLQNAWGAFFWNKQTKKQYSVVYSVNKYGPLAKLLADKSYITKEKYINYIECLSEYAIMKIYSQQTKIVHDVLIDLDDVEKIKNIKWYIKVPQNFKTFYAQSDKNGSLHRFILKPNNDLLVDHINRNGLDNRKSNLRQVTNSINKKNMSVVKSNKIGYNGICIENNFYRVNWSENGKSKHKRFSLNNPNALELAIKFRKQKEKEYGYVQYKNKEKDSTTI